MLSKKEKQVLRSLVKYHLNEVNKDSAPEELVMMLGAEAKYKKTLKDILKKI